MTNGECLNNGYVCDGECLTGLINEEYLKQSVFTNGVRLTNGSYLMTGMCLTNGVRVLN